MTIVCKVHESSRSTPDSMLGMLLGNELRVECISMSSALIWSSMIDTIIWCPISSFEIFIQSDARHDGIRFPKPKGHNGTLHQANIRILSDRYSRVMITEVSSDLHLIFRVSSYEPGCSTKLCWSASPYMHTTSYQARPPLAERWGWTMQYSLLILKFPQLSPNWKSKSLLFHSWC